ncbi:hypothetical protein TRFO_38985 [Tritrichomonas foetus]|uniref:Protein kinase domain-containing protein n=1 Tax=Tritrichomonas foetus TaxID=1144522 RepID=A0A1J4J6G6_9EUKA|nr:hypothetical protein TRFO_38985 [Tritrichomonas foetus]|eukprot:OHS94822.1 hypothetical protein TRFO_38985 [Tritrichomonas foetus]
MQSFSYNSYSEPSSLASFSSSPSSVALWIHDDYRNEEEVCKVLYGIFAANEKRVCQIQSPYVQKCINFVDMGERSEITFRKAKGGSLEDFVGKNGALKDRELRIIGYRLFKALYDIHSLNICHNDIRPENILLLEERDFTTSMLSNFGVSGQGEIYGSYGTEWFSSPECFSSSNNQNSYYNSPAYSIYEDEKSL